MLRVSPNDEPGSDGGVGMLGGDGVDGVDGGDGVEGKLYKAAESSAKAAMGRQQMATAMMVTIVVEAMVDKRFGCGLGFVVVVVGCWFGALLLSLDCVAQVNGKDTSCCAHFCSCTHVTVKRLQGYNRQCR